MSKYVGRIITDQAPAGYSVYFDGSGDYLTGPTNNAAFQFGTGDFTVEMWVNTANLAAYQTLLDTRSADTQSAWCLFLDNTGKPYWYDASGVQLSSTAVVANTWTHLAVSRSGSTLRMFLSGVQVFSGSNSNSQNPTGTFYVARNAVNAFLYTGYISNLRIVKGTALYTAAFTPPTQLLNVTNTSILTCNSPAIIDQSSNAFAITTNGNAAVSTFTPFVAYNPAPTSSNPLTPAPGVWTLDEALQYTQQGVWPSPAANAIEDVFSTYLYTGTGAAQSINNGIALGNSAANNSSISLNASTPSYLTFSSQVNLSGDFCIQAWVYPTSLTGTRLLFSSTSDTNVQMPRIQENGGIYCYVNGTEITSGAAASALQANVWTHLAMTRSGSTFRVFVNGSLYATATYSGTFNIGVLGVFFFSGSLFGTPYAFGGNISNAQIVSGSAVYTTNFTPPQNTLIGGSVLLGAGATPLADTSGTGKTVTQFGSPAASSSGPWAVGGNYGGLVWNKLRNNGTAYHYWVDTARGRSSGIGSNSTDAQYISSAGNDLTSFNTTGYTVGPVQNWNASNSNGGTIVSWTFRKQAKFFDIVTWTGDGTNPRTINHNLGSTPGCIIIKCTSSGVADWPVWHRSLPTQGGFLNTVDPFSSGLQYFGSTVTSTTFSLNSANVRTNQAGQTYVAYLFAHDAGGFGPAGADNVISCGSFTYSAGTEVNLGYEPQWLVIKRTDITTAGSWYVVDVTRGWTTDSNASWVTANTTDAEVSAALGIAPTATGFRVPTGYGTGSVYIYIAIRRGPMRPPTSGTSVFTPDAAGNNASAGGLAFDAGFPVDWYVRGEKSGSSKFYGFSRLTGNEYLTTTSTAAGAASTYADQFDSMTGIETTTGFDFTGQCAWLFRRAPGFLDVVCYTGTGANRTVSHNLTIVPEMMIVKRRDLSASWYVYTSTTGNTKYIPLNDTATPTTTSSAWNNTDPTNSVFTVSTSSAVNASGGTYVAYLFATVGGVSKVGSYTGTGALQTINCGFTSGARFVLIRRTDSTGDWWVYDSARGISSGNDPYLFLNSTAAEVTGTNYVDTASTGFQVTAAAPAGLNASGGNYIFLAIA